MENIKKRVISLLAVVFVAAASISASWLFFSKKINQLEAQKIHKTQELASLEKLLARRKVYEGQWTKTKALFPSVGRSDEALNKWVKELIGFAEGEGITFEKLQPVGVQEKKGQKQIRILVTFRSDVRKFIRFLYHLYEKDPVAYVDGFSVQDKEEKQGFLYELTLMKVVR